MLLLFVSPAVAQDTWESLPDVPFPYGVSAGGGLTTDGTCVYAADFSGDGDQDFIDLNHDGSESPGEALQQLGIANGSVRFARFSPASGTWAWLPTLNEAGVEGDSFSEGNLTGGLFYAGGSLFYYQFRAGPQRCALYRYDLAQGLEGAWIQVWDKLDSDALINANAGLTGMDTPSGPVILHHRGGGDYDFARSSGLTNGTPTHTTLTPNWYFSDRHFPRCGAWAYDTLRHRLYHMSGSQLLRWEASASYAPANLLNAIPDGSNPLAAFSTVINSLKTTLGWDPGGATYSGATLWGNAIVVVNDPSGALNGPGGLDTGANVLYLVRGETSSAGWPFNEGRGLINNGHFARYFPQTNQAQSLSPAPFHVGKGSAACYLDGAIYLLQGETTTGSDLSRDGIHRPGKGFARFAIRSPVVTGPLLIPIAEYLAGGFASLSAPFDNGTGTAPLFDQQWNTMFQAATNNPGDFIIGFTSARCVGAARARFGDDAYQWSLDAANSLSDLTVGTGSFVHIFGPADVTNGDIAWEEWNTAPVCRTWFRFRVARQPGGAVEVRELELQRAREPVTITVNGIPVQVNELTISPANHTALAGASVPFQAEASLSLGPDRYNVTTQAVWTSSHSSVATINAQGVASAIASGQAVISAILPGLSNTTTLTVTGASQQDNDISVCWIQRLPSLSYVWGSTNATVEGWPEEGSNVTWRAVLKNWYPVTRTNVAYRWLLDGVQLDAGTVSLSAASHTTVDLEWPWTFARHQLRFELDPANAVTEFTESNNVLSVWTDAISVGLWVEQTLYNSFHLYQYQLDVGANSWEDWAQRQVSRWNQMFAEAVHPIDAPQGVLDRIRLDKITIVPNYSLPLAGGLPGNNPDNRDRTVDLVWGFPVSCSGMYNNHTAVNDSNPFYFEGSLIHELGHARYLIDCYGFNVHDTPSKPSIYVRHNGSVIAGTPLLPRIYPWWDTVFISREGSVFEGLMGTTYTYVDRYSTMALNLIAGRRATMGNYNAPSNLGCFINGLPATNVVQLVSARGELLTNAAVTIYQATAASDWYGKRFDDIPDLSFIADTLGRINVGRNPFSTNALYHGNNLSTMAALMKVEANAQVGFAFLQAGQFNMEYWRGHTNQGCYQVRVPMCSASRGIAAVNSTPWGSDWVVQIIASGDTQPGSVTVAGVAAELQEGSWWCRLPRDSGEKEVVATWAGQPAIVESWNIPRTRPRPVLSSQLLPGLPTRVELSWQSSMGEAYVLETSTDLSSWSQVEGRSFGTGETLRAEPEVSAPCAFYRVVAYALGD